MRFHEIRVIKKKKGFHIRISYELPKKKNRIFTRYRCNVQKNKYIRVSYYNIK